MRPLPILAAVGIAAGAGIVVGVLATRGGQKPSRPAPTVVTRARRRARPRPVLRGPHNHPVPILMYHVIGFAPAGAPLRELYVSRGDFRAQLQWLASHGYRAVTLHAVYAY